MIQTGSDFALMDASANFKKIPYFQEATIWNTQETCEDLVMHVQQHLW